jgi:hypothetical protein
VSGNNYKPNVLSQFVLLAANYLSQTASNAIANDCATQSA